MFQECFLRRLFSPPDAVSDRAVRIPGTLQTLLGEVFPQETVLPSVLFFWELLVQQAAPGLQSPWQCPRAAWCSELSCFHPLSGEELPATRAAPVGAAESLKWELRLHSPKTLVHSISEVTRVRGLLLILEFLQKTVLCGCKCRPQLYNWLLFLSGLTRTAKSLQDLLGKAGVASQHFMSPSICREWISQLIFIRLLQVTGRIHP